MKKYIRRLLALLSTPNLFYSSRRFAIAFDLDDVVFIPTLRKGNEYEPMCFTGLGLYLRIGAFRPFEVPLP